MFENNCKLYYKSSLCFSFEIVETPDGTTGIVYPNGTVSGEIGMVARREAHFTVNEITITGDNEQRLAQITSKVIN